MKLHSQLILVLKKLRIYSSLSILRQAVVRRCWESHQLWHRNLLHSETRNLIRKGFHYEDCQKHPSSISGKLWFCLTNHLQSQNITPHQLSDDQSEKHSFSQSYFFKKIDFFLCNQCDEDSKRHVISSLYLYTEFRMSHHFCVTFTKQKKV